MTLVKNIESKIAKRNKKHAKLPLQSPSDIALSGTKRNGL